MFAVVRSLGGTYRENDQTLFKRAAETAAASKRDSEGLLFGAAAAQALANLAKFFSVVDAYAVKLLVKLLGTKRSLGSQEMLRAGSIADHCDFLHTVRGSTFCGIPLILLSNSAN